VGNKQTWCIISEAGVPEKEFSNKLRNPSEDMFEIVWGMGPDSLFPAVCNVFNRWRLPIDRGRKPIKLLAPRYKYWSCDKFPKATGIPPSNLLKLIWRTFNLCNWHNSLGTWPPKLLFLRSSITRKDRFPKFGETVPLRLMFWRIKLWTLPCRPSQVTPTQLHTEEEVDQLLVNIS